MPEETRHPNRPPAHAGPSALNGFETKAVYLVAIGVFVGAAVLWAYLAILQGTEPPTALTVILGFGIAFIRDFLTEQRMAKRIDWYETEVVNRVVDLVPPTKADTGAIREQVNKPTQGGNNADLRKST